MRGKKRENMHPKGTLPLKKSGAQKISVCAFTDHRPTAGYHYYMLPEGHFSRSQWCDKLQDQKSYSEKKRKSSRTSHVTTGVCYLELPNPDHVILTG